MSCENASEILFPHRLARRPPRRSHSGTRMASKPVRLLAFGDSLTAGWTSFSSGPKSPYAPHLERALTAHSVAAHVTAVGEAGLSASRALPSLRRELAHRGDFDACLILLGANDVLSAPTEPIDGMLEALRALHVECRSRGLRSIAVGFPDHPAFAASGLRGSGALAAINDRIRDEADADGFIDPHGMLPRAAHWSADRVHMTAEGYRTFGGALAAPVARLLLPERRTERAGRRAGERVLRSREGKQGADEPVQRGDQASDQDLDFYGF